MVVHYFFLRAWITTSIFKTLTFGGIRRLMLSICNCLIHLKQFIDLSRSPPLQLHSIKQWSTHINNLKRIRNNSPAIIPRMHVGIVLFTIQNSIIIYNQKAILIYDLDVVCCWSVSTSLCMSWSSQCFGLLDFFPFASAGPLAITSPPLPSPFRFVIRTIVVV